MLNILTVENEIVASSEKWKEKCVPTYVLLYSQVLSWCWSLLEWGGCGVEKEEKWKLYNTHDSSLKRPEIPIPLWAFASSI